MLVRDVPEADRPRERLARLGSDALSDRDLLAVMLHTSGTRGTSVHELAERMLSQFGGVGGLARATVPELQRVAGVGIAKALALVAAFALARRAEPSEDQATLDSSAVIAAAARPWLAARSRERAIVLSCDNRLRLLGVDVISDGSAHKTALPTREILTAVLRRDGSSLAIAHNHPSGDPEPSREDIAATLRIRDGAEHVGLRLLDHVVIAGRQWRSAS